MGAKIEAISFEAGLVDELVEVRATAVNYGRGARRMENMIAGPWGPALSRPPSRFIASTKGNGRAVLMTVVYSDQYAYQVEFGNLYCRFYTDAGRIESGGSAYEIVSPYAAADLERLQGYNDAGTLYLVDGAHAPCRLVYSAAAAWTLEAIPFTWGPFRDLNDEQITLTPSGTTGSITLTAAGGTPFVTGAAGHVGAPVLLGHRVSEASLIHTFTGNDTSATIAVAKGAGWQSASVASKNKLSFDAKNWKLVTSGSWNATLHLEKTYDGGTNWETVATYAPDSDTNFPDVGDESFDDALYRLRVENWVSGSVRVTFTVNAHWAFGYATITSVTSSTVAVATVAQTLAATTATKVWAFGSWCPLYGYPRGIGCVDNRLSLVGTTADPTTEWLSRPNRYTEMRTDNTAASALVFPFTTKKGDPFLWILGEQYQHVIGTPSAILVIAAADPRSALSAENKPEITKRIEFGSAAIPPVRAHAATVLMDSSRLRPVKITYDWEQDILLGPPMNFECPTVTEPGIQKLVFQRGRIPMVWALRDDGWVLGCTFEQLFRQEIIGWTEHWTAGADAEIEDIGVLPGSGGDSLWWIAARTVGGATVRTIERLDALDLEPVRATAHALDSYVLFEGAAWADIEALTVNAVTGVITVTITGHGLDLGDQIDLIDLIGMEWLNARILTVADVAANSFSLKTTGGAYVDGRLLGTYTSGGRVRQVENTFSGLDHLEGESVYAVADGMVLGPYTVAGGAITISRWANRVAAGLFVDAWLQPLRLAVPLADGSSRGRLQNVTGAWVSVYRSWDFEIGPSADKLKTVVLLTPGDEVEQVPELQTCDFFVPIVGNLTLDPTLVIHRHLPLPLCVRGLMLDTDMGGQRGGKH